MLSLVPNQERSSLGGVVDHKQLIADVKHLPRRFARGQALRIVRQGCSRSRPSPTSVPLTPKIPDVRHLLVTQPVQ
jgi:hypothetical protein